jgi:ubiquinone/menaquinone biosynthesis C-methylase UbiE
MTDVIHHVRDLISMFSQIRRVLKCGGRLCVVTESHKQIQSRFYNSYFPSLAANEKERYPDIQSIVDVAANERLIHEETEVLAAAQRRTISQEFLRCVEEKNYSMFHLLDEREYADGLARLTADAGKAIDAVGAGESLIWIRKPD